MIPADRIVQLDSDEGARITATLREGEVTALFGSGVSGFAPTSLPTGMAVGKAIAERLAEGGVSRRELLVQLLSETAFEQVMERCPQPERVRGFLSRKFRDVPANDIHRAFARLTGRGVIRHLVTTNYDVGLEAAFRDAAPSTPLTMVRDRAEAECAESDAPHVLFKIHGCATGPFAHDMAFRLTDEAQLPEWKRETLRRLVVGRTLLVVAYSGMDFEICPELAEMGAARLVWLHYGDLKWITPNAWRVVREAGGVVLLGSAQALAGALLGEGEVGAQWAPGAVDDFAAELFVGFSEEELDAWRARLFGEIGCGRDAEAVADRMLKAAELYGDDGARARAFARRGQGLFHQGRYIEAAGDYARAARLARRVRNLHDLREALNGVVECNRCAGRMGRTMLALGALAAFVRQARGTPEHLHARTDQQMRQLVLGGTPTNSPRGWSGAGSAGCASACGARFASGHGVTSMRCPPSRRRSGTG